MVLQLFLPESVDKVTFEIIRRVLKQGGIASLLSNLRVALTKRVEPLLFWCFDDQRIDVHWPVQVSCFVPIAIQFPYFFVPGSSETIVKVQFISTSSSLTSCPSWGAFATCIVISKLLLPVAYVTRPDSCKSHISVSGELIVMRSQDAVTVVTSSPVCLSVDILRPLQSCGEAIEAYTQ
jgi:hypothetical protein